MNTNCLKGWKCPECGSEEPFKIFSVTITADIVLSDDGTVEDDVHNTDWEKWSPAECMECGHEGRVIDFCSADHLSCTKDGNCHADKEE
jgi:hypothetical protein